MVRQPWLLVEPTDHGTHQAQRTAAAATRGHPTPPGAGVLVPPPPQPGGQAHDDPQRHGQHGQPARPRSHRRDPCLGTAPPPWRITTAGLAAWPGCIRCHGLRCCRGSMGHPRPAAPCALGLALPTPREPPRSGIPRTVAPAAQRATAGSARTAPRVALAPHPSATDLRALCDPHDTSPSPRRQPGEQRDLGNAPIGGHAHPPRPHRAAHACQGAPAAGEFVTRPPAVPSRHRLGPPRDRHRPPADQEGAHQAVLVSCPRPVAGQPYWAVRRKLDAGVQEPRIGPGPRLQARMVEHARPPLGGSFLRAKATGQWGLTAGLLVHNGRHQGTNRVALMARCPRQQIPEIIVETSSRRVWRSQTSRLASRRKPWLLVTL